MVALEQLATVLNQLMLHVISIADNSQMAPLKQPWGHLAGYQLSWE